MLSHLLIPYPIRFLRLILQNHLYAYALHHGSPTTSMIGITDTGCTNILIPMSVALEFQLSVVPLINSIPMHFAETGTLAATVYGVYRPAEFVWWFIAVTDKLSEILIDIKHLVRVGYTFVADHPRASLIQSQPPHDTVLLGPSQSNGCYKWDF